MPSISPINNHFSKIERYVFFALSAALWVYIALRAWFVPFTQDEVANFFHYVAPGDIWPGGKTLWDANNHVLNTYLTRFSYLLFGSSEWALRLPTVLIAGLYFTYVFKFAQRLHSISLRWTLVLSLMFAHVIIEFMSFTRGYGMSFAFMLAGLYYMYCYINTLKSWHLLGGLAFFILAVGANLNLLILFLLVLTYLVLRILYSYWEGKRILVHLAIVLGLVSVPIYWFIWYGFQLKSRGKLYYGSEEGFWNGTVDSLARYLVFDGEWIGHLFLTLLFLCVLLLVIVQIKNRGLKELFKESLIFPYLLIGNISANIIMHWLLGTPYQTDRTALFYFPLTILSLAFLAQSLDVDWKKTALNGLLALMVFFPVHFIFSMNLTHSNLWNVDASMKKFVKMIMDDAGMDSYRVSVSGGHMRGFPFAFYNRLLADGHFNQAVSFSITDGEADYQIVNKEDCERCELYDSLAYDEISGLYLMKRKQLLKHENLLTIGSINSEGETTDGEYLVTQRIDIDTLDGQDLELEYEWTLDMPENTRIWLIYDITDNDDQSLRYEFMGANWPKKRFNGEPNNFHYSVLLTNIPEGAKTINTYIWNQNREVMSIKNGTIKLNRLVEP